MSQYENISGLTVGKVIIICLLVCIPTSAIISYVMFRSSKMIIAGMVKEEMSNVLHSDAVQLYLKDFCEENPKAMRCVFKKREK